MLHCLSRYPILRIVGVAALLAAWAAAAFLTGYPSRLTPVGGFLAGKLPWGLCVFSASIWPTDMHDLPHQGIHSIMSMRACGLGQHAADCMVLFTVILAMLMMTV